MADPKDSAKSEPLWQRLPDGSVLVRPPRRLGPDPDPKTTLLLRAAFRYAAFRGLAEPPRNPDGGIGGPALAVWFEALDAFAKTDPSEHARSFLEELTAIDTMPESA